MSNFEYFVKNQFTELTLGLIDGMRIAVKCWGKEFAKIKILVKPLLLFID
jgi:hypothetical protein